MSRMIDSSFVIFLAGIVWVNVISNGAAQTEEASTIPLVVVSPAGCPSVGEIQAALGAQLAVIESPRAPAPEVRAVIGLVEINEADGGIVVHVEFPGLEPVVRALPRIDCATAARLVAIVVRGVDFRRSQPRAPIANRADLEPIAETACSANEMSCGAPDGRNTSSETATPTLRESAALHFSIGLATGLSVDILPAESAWSGQLDMALRFDALFLRLAFIGASPTHIALVSGLSLERIAFGPRFDVGAAFVATDRLSFGGALGAGLMVARLSSPSIGPSEFMRVSPTVGGQLFALLEIVDLLPGFLELAVDFPIMGDTYLIEERELALAQSPAAVLRTLIGARVAFR